jgi:hypothetical protein
MLHPLQTSIRVAYSLQKLNKAPLQTFLVNIVSLYDKNISLCKSAAAKCDQIKSEQRCDSKVTAKTVKEAVRAVNEKEERSRNLIIYGVAEGEEDDWNEVLSTEWLIVVKSVHGATVADGSFPNVDKVYRLGKKIRDTTRPMKVEFRSPSDVDDILKNAHKLKANSELKSVYLSLHRTKEQGSAHGKLVNQMIEMIARDSSKHYFIRANKVNYVDQK